MTHLKRASVLSLVLTIVAVFLTAQSALAVGTPSNTTISNTATINFTVGGVGQAAVNSLPATFVVDNIVNLNVTSNSGSNVVPGSTNVALPFTITNTGNTSQGYSLLPVAGTTSIPMNPASVRIYIDEGTTPGVYDAGDILYTTGTNVRDLDPNGAPGADSINVIIVANAPATATANGLQDTYSLLATTLDAGTTTVTTETAGGDTAGVDVVFADNALAPAIPAGPEDAVTDGMHSASGVYTITSAVLSVAKTSGVYSDPINGTTDPKAIPGAIVTYTIVVTNSGSADANAVTVVDNIPANTTYSAGSITIDTIGMSDIADGDNADYDATNTGAITAVIPTIAGSGATATVTFNVEIQ